MRLRRQSSGASRPPDAGMLVGGARGLQPAFRPLARGRTGPGANHHPPGVANASARWGAPLVGTEFVHSRPRPPSIRSGKSGKSGTSGTVPLAVAPLAVAFDFSPCGILLGRG